ncbi:nicotinate phosphoribosyltransferase [Candidatus Bathyarchaeota archaeon]|nr:nicotinate phosphoribosyltransferase [Candidatus Bathyarchaeota archaeon]
MQGYTKNRGLFTDLYQLTMSQGYHALEMEEKEATFDLFFRNNPFNGGYAIACGIKTALEYLVNMKFTREDIEYLQEQDMFSDEFLSYLEGFSFTGTVKGIVDGTVIFPFSPILRITAPIIEAQLVETALLNIINYSTLIATKAARITEASRGGNVIEFGLRRAQGDAAYLGTYAALVGGCTGTSFVDGGRQWKVPIVGTHAHSWVQMFPSELEAFRAYAKVFPDKCVLLVDTYDTLESGVPNAITVARELKERGKKLVGIRIDSGDLAYLSVRAYKQLKDAGFGDASIVLSNNLNETVIDNLTRQITEGTGSTHEDENLREETIKHLLYGVGTKLITGGKQAALGGVYKLVAVDGKPKIKISENVIKTINPGLKTVHRVKGEDGYLIADVLAIKGERAPLPGDIIYHPIDPYKTYELDDGITTTALHEVLVDKGKNVAPCKDESWQDAQERCKRHLAMVHPTNRRLLNPHSYKVSLTAKLFDLKKRMIEEKQQG